MHITLLIRDAVVYKLIFATSLRNCFWLEYFTAHYKQTSIKEGKEKPLNKIHFPRKGLGVPNLVSSKLVIEYYS